MYTSIRRFTSIVLIIATVAFAFLAIFSIWDLVPKDVTTKSLESLVLAGVAFGLIILACLEREGKVLSLSSAPGAKPASLGRVILTIIIFLFLGQMLIGFLSLLIR